MSVSPRRVDSNAILLPSGDHVGWASCWLPRVSRTIPLPPGLIRYRLDVFSSPYGPRWKTIRPFAPGKALVAGPEPVATQAAAITAAPSAALNISCLPLLRGAFLPRRADPAPAVLTALATQVRLCIARVRVSRESVRIFRVSALRTERDRDLLRVTLARPERRN